MIADKFENLKLYPEFAPYAEVMTAFAQRAEAEKLPDGKYELDGENLFALVQSYTTKPRGESRIEAHKLYADLQLIVEGEECIGWTPVDGLEIEEDRTPGADILFYRGQTRSETLLLSGMFGYYAPSDGHMPCIAPGECAAAKKIVYKIRVTK